MSTAGVVGLVLAVLGLGAGGGGLLQWVQQWRQGARTAGIDEDRLDLERLRAINADALALVESQRIEHARFERLEQEVARLNGELRDVHIKLDETRAEHHDCTNRLRLAEARIAEMGG